MSFKSHFLSLTGKNLHFELVGGSSYWESTVIWKTSVIFFYTDPHKGRLNCTHAHPNCHCY